MYTCVHLLASDGSRDPANVIRKLLGREQTVSSATHVAGFSCLLGQNVTEDAPVYCFRV